MRICADKFMKNDPDAVKNHSPDIFKPFIGEYDQNLKDTDWTPQTQVEILKSQLDSDFTRERY